MLQFVDINKNKIKILIFKDKCPDKKNINQISILEDEKSTESKYDSEDNYLEDTNKDYFGSCLQIFLDMKESLNIKFNIFPENMVEKKYILRKKKLKKAWIIAKCII